MTDDNPQTEQVTERVTKSYTSPYFWLIFIIILTIFVLLGFGGFQLLTQHTKIENMTQSIDGLSQQLTALQKENIENKTKEAPSSSSQFTLLYAKVLIEMANNQMSFGNPSSALELLNQALNIITQLNDTKLATLSQALKNDIAKLNTAPSSDLSELYLKINELDKTIDQLPFPALPLMPSTNGPNAQHGTFWQKLLAKSKQTLQQIVIVRRTDSDVMFPAESKPFLYQNLHAQIENMMWAVLHHNTAVYHASIDRASKWIAHYFDQHAGLTKQTLAELASLKEQSLQIEQPDLAATLHLFDQLATNTNG